MAQPHSSVSTHPLHELDGPPPAAPPSPNDSSSITAHSPYLDEPGVPPRLRAKVWHRRWKIFAYAVFLLFCNLAAPCIMYYVLNDYTDVGIRERMGIGSALLGASSCVDAPLRLYKCIRYHRTRGPLMSNEDDGTSADAGEEDERSRWWHLDFSMHIYTVALFAMAFPLAIGPVVDPPIERFFLLTMPILVAPLGLTGFVSLVPFRIPRHVRISSDNHGERVKPLAYYAVEDVCAVDARGGRSFRRAMRRRWRQSPPFRKLLRVVTLWWSLGSVILFGTTAAVVWTISFGFAWGLVLGMFFIWMLLWLLVTMIYVKWALAREHAWWRERHAGTKLSPMTVKESP